MSSESIPPSFKDRLTGIFWGGLIIALGAWMICRPESPLHPDEMTRAKTYLFSKILDWIWGIPGGIIIALLGMLVFVGSQMPKKPGQDDDD